jgi:hypothetical protein
MNSNKRLHMQRLWYYPSRFGDLKERQPNQPVWNWMPRSDKNQERNDGMAWQTWFELFLMKTGWLLISDFISNLQGRKTFLKLASYLIPSCLTVCSTLWWKVAPVFRLDYCALSGYDGTWRPHHPWDSHDVRFGYDVQDRKK